MNLVSNLMQQYVLPISVWASREVRLARWIIAVLGYAFFPFLLFFTGISLATEGIEIPIWWVFILFGVSLMAYTQYPRSGRVSHWVSTAADRYAFRRICHLVMFLWAWTMAMCGGNYWANQASESLADVQVVESVVQKKYSAAPYLDFIKQKKVGKEAKKWIIKQVKEMPMSAGTYALIALGCLVGSLLLIGLACTNGCSGNPIFAVLAVIIGVLANIAFYVFLILAIVRLFQGNKSSSQEAPQQITDPVDVSNVDPYDLPK